MNERYDTLIVGSGAGGSAAAYALAHAGRRVLLLEKGRELPRDGSTLDVDKVIRQGIFKSKEHWLDKNGRTFEPEEYFNLGGKTKWYGAALARFEPHEFEAERGRWLRKRFLWYAAVVIGFSLLATTVSLVGMLIVSKALVPRALIWSTMGGLGVTLIGTVLYAIGFFKVYTRQYTRDELLRLVVRLILAAGLLGQAGNILNVELTRPLARRAYSSML